LQGVGTRAADHRGANEKNSREKRHKKRNPRSWADAKKGEYNTSGYKVKMEAKEETLMTDKGRRVCKPHGLM